MIQALPLFADSITTLPPDHEHRVVVCGSHGGLYPAALALAARLRAVVLNDAGGGLDGAGFECVTICEAAGMAACTVAASSCRIGDARDMLDRGVVSRANAHAMACGVEVGAPLADSHVGLGRAEPATGEVPSVSEARTVIEAGGRELVLVDSASLVTAQDEGRVVVTGSHGGLIGGDPTRALKADAAFALFNDAGMGPDGCGTSRLPALDRRGVAAATVAAMSARIGAARSTLEDGVVSAVNETASRAGVAEGMNAREAVQLFV